MRKNWSLGDIAKSPAYISLEIKPSPWHLSFGPTYNGTRRGLVACFGFGTILAHTRTTLPVYVLGNALNWSIVNRWDRLHSWVLNLYAKAILAT